MASKSEVEELKGFVDEVHEDLTTIQKEFHATVNQINVAFRDIDGIFAKHRQQKKLYLELQSQLTELKKEFGTVQEMEGIESTLSSIKEITTELGLAKRKTGSVFVSLIMGAVNCRIWNEGDRFKFKSEYNRFKERWMLIFFVFPMLQIVFPLTQSPLWQIQSLLFLYYYTTLAIRENLLSLNGSRIEPWWIYHHYVSMLISVLSLMLDPEHSLFQGLYLLNYFFMFQGIVMLLQADYQKRRHYARKALAKKGKLDIRTSEVLDETPHARYRLLIPALYVTYFMQLVISIYFLFLSVGTSTNLAFCQTILASSAWFVLCIGNTSTLSKVLQKKKRQHAAAKQRKDSQRR